MLFGFSLAKARDASQAKTLDKYEVTCTGARHDILFECMHVNLTLVRCHCTRSVLQKRYTIDDSTEPARIRANQGHSYEVKDLELEPITDASQVPFAVHVTGRQG